MTIEERFESLLRPLFRKDVRFIHVTTFNDGLLYRVDWNTPEDGRPNKHSRPIEVLVTQEVVEDYREAPYDAIREAMEYRITAWVKSQLAGFNPDHDYRREQVVPAVRWVVSPQIAGG